MKRGIFLFAGLIGVIVILAVAWYLISPAFNEIEANEESPLVGDSFDSMSQEEKAEFEEAVEAMSDDVMTENQAMPNTPQIISMGVFKPRAHEVEGRAILIEVDGKKTLRFEDFETINGPNLHIYLASSLSEDDFIDLGEIKATKGNVNYEIPEGVDTEKYDKVLVWCVPFSVLFSYSELEEV